MGVSYVWKMVGCVASYSQIKGKAVLSVYIAAKDVLASLHYYQAEAH